MRRSTRWDVKMSMRWPVPQNRIREWVMGRAIPRRRWIKPNSAARLQRLSNGNAESGCGSRSSATAEDLPMPPLSPASRKTFLNIRGVDM